MALSNNTKYEPTRQWLGARSLPSGYHAPRERFFRSFKTEWMPKEYYRSYDEAETDVYQYIILHYNIARGHSYNNYLSPNAAEKLICSH